MNFLFILRGQPGLGHVIPGAALAGALNQINQNVYLASYGAGVAFLRDTDFTNILPLEVSSDYVDYPGLTLYDHGLRQIIPMIDALDIDRIVFCGEYVLGFLGECLKQDTYMTFNPEIFIEGDRNQATMPFFVNSFNKMSGLLPLRDYDPLDWIEGVKDRLPQIGPSGPYRFQDLTITDPEDATVTNLGRKFLVSNGGGTLFPKSLQSYSSASGRSLDWLKETFEMTRDAVCYLTKNYLEPQDELRAYSCLDPADNAEIHRLAGGNRNIKILQPQTSYYDFLQVADFAIARAGAGTIADLQTFGGKVILWPLGQHDEQKYNACQFCDPRANASWIDDPDDLSSQIDNMMREPIDKTSALGVDGCGVAALHEAAQFLTS